MTVKIFKARVFSVWASGVGLTDEMLKQAAREVERGLVDADLGSYVFKKRIAQGGRGKRSGWRTLIAFRRAGNLFYIYGFSKQERANITVLELKALRKLAKELTLYGNREIALALRYGELVEVTQDENIHS